MAFLPQLAMVPVVLFLPFVASGQTSLSSGASLPSPCQPGDVFFQLNLPLDHSFFACQAGNAWSETDPAASGIAVVQRFGAMGDGASDDQSALQSAADFVRSSGGGIVFVPPGRYQHSSMIEFGSGTTLQGAGRSSVLLATNFPYSSLHFSGSRNCAVKQLATNSGATVRLFTPPTAAILFEGASNCHVSDVFINGSGSAGIMVRYSSDMLIEHTDIRNTMADGIHVVDGSQRVTVSNNRAFNTGDDSFAAVSYANTAQTDTISFDQNVSIFSVARGVTCIGASNCSITNNRVYSPRGHGIAVAQETVFNTYYPRAATVQHNLVRGVTTYGMNSLLVSSATDVTVDDLRVYDGNSIYLHGSNNVRTSGMRVFNAMNMGIAGVGGSQLTIEKSEVIGAGGPGILLDGVEVADVNANYVADPFRSGPAVFGAIDVAASDAVTGAGNQVYSGQAASSSVLRVASSTSSSVSANSSSQSPVAQPVIGSVVGAGLSTPAAASLSPNGMISVFGSGFAPSGTQITAGPADLVQSHLPSTLGGACLEMGGEPAYLLYISPTQINAIAASPATGQQTSVEVVVNCGQASEVRSNLAMLRTAETAPEFFFWQRGSGGHNSVLAFDAVTFSALGQPNAAGVAASAYPGEEIGIYLNGAGLTTTNFDPGAVPQSPAPAAYPFAVFLNGTQLAPSSIRYFGSSTFAGVYQLNLHVPDNIAPGEVQIQVKVNDEVTPAGSYFVVGAK